MLYILALFFSGQRNVPRNESQCASQRIAQDLQVTRELRQFRRNGRDLATIRAAGRGTNRGAGPREGARDACRRGSASFHGWVAE